MKVTILFFFICLTCDSFLHFSASSFSFSSSFRAWKSDYSDMKRKSGHQRAVEAAAERRREGEIMANVPKMTSFTVPMPVDPTDGTAFESSPNSGQEPHSSSDNLLPGASNSSDIATRDSTEEQPSPKLMECDANHEHLSRPQSTEPGADETEPCCSTDPDRDVGLWGDLTELLRKRAIEKGAKYFQNRQDSYPESKRVDKMQNRYFQSTLFKETLQNGDIVDRGWLVYSPSKGAVFCFACRLFHSDQRDGFSSGGFSNWKHPERITQHARTERHRSAILLLCDHATQSKTIDSAFMTRFKDEKNYWKKVLHRCLAVTRFLSERGLAFRGSDEVIGSLTNGNYLGALELLAEFDAFLAEHISRHANKGRGHSSYLSKTISEELIKLLADMCLKVIKQGILDSKYFSISVDSSPDVSHVDQLTVIIRYIDMNTFMPVERFLTFIPISGSHTGENLAATLLSYLSEQEIPFSFCRGQTYDNASNMSGKYSGMQTHLKKENPLADYIPCAGHSLNLVGQDAVDCCVNAVSFFGFLQQLYVFFSKSTRRWEILVKHLQPHGLVPKKLSDTRWSCRSDATRALSSGYKQFFEALDELANNPEEKAETRLEAESLASTMETLETAFMCELWNEILQKFNITSASLQSSTIELVPAIALIKSLKDPFLKEVREKFDAFEETAKIRSGCQEYRGENQRSRRRKKQFDEGPAPDAAEAMTPRKKFISGTFNVIIDNLNTALDKRIEAYELICNRFAVFTKFDSMLPEEIDLATDNLVATYVNDLTNDFGPEFKQFLAWFKQTESGGVKQSISAQSMFSLLHSAGVASTFPNTEAALRIYLCLMSTNCTGERSFSFMKRIKALNRASMGQERFENLSLLAIESDILRLLDLDQLIELFASSKIRKTDIAGFFTTVT